MARRRQAYRWHFIVEAVAGADQPPTPRGGPTPRVEMDSKWLPGYTEGTCLIASNPRLTAESHAHEVV
jgi:hypothetical protein